MAYVLENVSITIVLSAIPGTADIVLCGLSYVTCERSRRYDHQIREFKAKLGNLFGVLNKVSVRSLRGINNEKLRFRRDHGFELFHVELPVRFGKRRMVDFRPYVFSPYFVGRITGVRKYHLVPLFQEREQRHGEGVLGAGGHNHFFRFCLSPLPRHLGSYGFPELRKAGSRIVPDVTVLECLHGSLQNVIRRVEIRTLIIPFLEMDYLLPGRFLQLPGDPHAGPLLRWNEMADLRAEWI
jgi:hypothetical protein